jgi:hypothetical protein
MKHFASILFATLLLFACSQSEKQEKISQTIFDVDSHVDTLIEPDAKPVTKTYTKRNGSMSFERGSTIIVGDGITLSNNDTSDILSISGTGFITTVTGRDDGFYEPQYPTYRSFLDKGEQDIIVYDKGEWITVYKTTTLTNPTIVNLSLVVAESGITDSATINSVVDTLRQILLTPSTSNTFWINLPPPKRE